MSNNNPELQLFYAQTEKEIQEKYKFKPKTPGQQYFKETIEDCIVTLCSGPAGSGKALSLDAKIYTPDGYILNKDIKIGDKVCTPNGGAANVIGVFPQKEKSLYRITFDDNSTIDCCEEHLWEVTHNQNGWTRIVDTKYIRDNFLYKNRKVLKIKTTQPVTFTTKTYFINPYILGILLSEGAITENVRFSSVDSEIINKMNKLIHNEYEINKTYSNSKHDFVIKRKTRNNTNKYKDELVRLKLFGLKSIEKFIPEEYLHGDINQRLLLMQGIMDGDGTVHQSSGMPMLNTSSEKLKDTFINLVNSLGGTTKVSTKIPTYTYKNEKRTGKLSYNISICLPKNISCFLLSRKALLQKNREKYLPVRYIEKVEYIGKKLSQCIMIDSKEQLYLTNNFIVTHNTHVALGKGIEYLKEGKFKRIILIRPIQECGKSIGFFPGKKEEKIAPHMRVFVELFGNFLTIDEIKQYQADGSIIVDVLEFMRGLTFNDSYIVVDEAQNYTYAQLQMILTRIGHNTKLVMNGDETQVDLWEKMWYKNRIPYSVVLDRLDNKDDDIGMVELTESDIVRSDIVKKIVKYLC